MGVIEWIAVAAVLAVATVLRVYGLTAGGFHIDEGYSLIQSERDLVDIFFLNRFDANPPFYIATLHIWRGFWGDEEFALKSLGVLGGILGVLGVWLAGRERFGAIAGIASSSLVALNAFHIHHSQEVRGYSLLFAAVAFADYFFVRWSRRGESWALVLWGVASWYAVNTHHFAWYFVILYAIGMSIGPTDRERRAMVWRTLACVALASTPMLVSFAIHIVVHQSQSWIPMKSFESLVTILGAIAGYPPLAFAVWGCALVGSMVPVPSAVASPTDVATKVRGQVRKTARRARGIDLLVPGLQLLMPGLIWLGSHLFFPMLLSRYCLIALLPLAVLASRAIAFLSSRLLLFAVALAIIGLSFAPIERMYENELRLAHVQLWADVVRDGYAPGDVVVYSDKYIFVPAIALHDKSMHEFLLPDLAGRHRSSVLEHYTSRTVRRSPIQPGEYQRIWLVKRRSESLGQVMQDPWFAHVNPRLLNRVGDTEVYLFALSGESSSDRAP